MSPFNQPSIDMITAAGRLETLYVVFQKDDVAEETLRTTDEYGRVCVDVDENDTPIALEVGWERAQPTEVNEISESEAIIRYFEFAVQTVNRIRSAETATLRVRSFNTAPPQELMQA